MESDSTLAAIALAISLFCFVIVALGEVSTASIPREKIQRLVSQGVRGSASLERLQLLSLGPTSALSLTRGFFSTASVLSAVALVLALVGPEWVVIALASLAVVIFLGVIHGVVRGVASANGDQIALKIAAPVHSLAWLLTPLSTVALMAERVLGRRAASGPDTFSGEISLQLDSDGGPLDEHEVRMIRGVVRLDKTIAREIMVPRVDMVVAEVGTSIAELAEQMITGGHSRIPVYRGDLDHMEGIAHARDVLRHLVREEEPSVTPVDTVIRPALFIPESKTLEELLNEFQQTRVHMAFVVDEYGGVSGLVTIEDLLEEIVGEIQDEFDVGEPEIEALSQEEFLVDARVGIDQLNELMNVSLEGDGFDTLGGFVYHRLGRIPSPGDGVEYNGLRIEVISTIGRRLKRLKVTRSSEGDASEDP